jgi:hypothetical protein
MTRNNHILMRVIQDIFPAHWHNKALQVKICVQNFTYSYHFHLPHPNYKFRSKFHLFLYFFRLACDSYIVDATISKLRGP